MEVNQLIKEIRKTYNLSQKQFAELLGVSQQEISKLETNHSKLTLDTLIIICSKLDYHLLMNISSGHLTSLNSSFSTLIQTFSSLSKPDQKLIIDLIQRLSSAPPP